MGHEGLNVGSAAKRQESQRNEGGGFLSDADYIIRITHLIYKTF
jgi:hypothetical protein